MAWTLYKNAQSIISTPTRSVHWPSASAPPYFAQSESPRYIGRAVAALEADPKNVKWNQQTVTTAQLARQYGVTDVDGSQPDAWGAITGDR